MIWYIYIYNICTWKQLANYKNKRKSLWKIDLPRRSRSLCLRLSMIRPKKGGLIPIKEQFPQERVEP